MTFSVFNKLNMNAGLYKIKYTCSFPNFQSLPPLTQYFDLEILPAPGIESAILAPFFVVPNIWKSSADLSCA